MSITLETLQNKHNKLQGQLEHISNSIQEESRLNRLKRRKLEQYEQAKEIVRLVGQKTQEQLQYHIGDITSLALDSIFKDPYQLEVEFVQRRNKTECDLYFSREGCRVDPLSASGGGAVDVAAFALRIASWSLNRPHTRPMIILDEPMRFVSEDLQEKASLMLSEISKRLGLQFIIITHEPSLTIHADKIFEVKNTKGISRIK